MAEERAGDKVTQEAVCSRRERQWQRIGSKPQETGPRLKSVPTPQALRSHNQDWPRFSDQLRIA